MIDSHYLNNDGDELLKKGQYPGKFVASLWGRPSFLAFYPESDTVLNNSKRR